MRACLKCGFVHDGIVHKDVRHDKGQPFFHGGPVCGSTPEIKPYDYRIYYYECPECGEEQEIKTRKIKVHK